MQPDSFRHGDVVEVRGPAEILGTLDEHGMLDGLPFMPEMLRYCGQRFMVDKRAEKVCDTIYPLASRKLPDTVLLEDLRCDGSGHDGCQAECRLFWKEAWLRRVDTGTPGTPVDEPADSDALADLIRSNAKSAKQIGTQEALYRCQATELHRASLPLGRWNPRPLLREYQSGNVSFVRFLRITARAFVQEPLRKLGKPLLPLYGTGKRTRPTAPLNLQPGELVQVKSPNEIVSTLNSEGRNRGLSFDAEMLPYCGRTFRVRQRVRRFIDDRTAQMVELKNECITLDGVICSGDWSPVRWLCPRAIFPYWREAWLRRVGIPLEGVTGAESLEPDEDLDKPDQQPPSALEHPGFAQISKPDATR